MDGYFGDVWLVRLLIQRGMAAIYFVAFLNVLNQFRPLLGERGLSPVPDFLKRVGFREAPSLFHFGYTDRRLTLVAWTGILLSVSAMAGLSESGPVWLSLAVWLTMYALYLSIVNVGQTFYAFGWESMLLEAGFFTAFLGPAGVEPSIIPVLALRWMLFRTEVGAGLIKIRHDECWRNLTCLYYHHETQPMPNPLSAHFHHLPKVVHRGGALFSHFVQLVIPFALFLPQPISSIAGGFIIVHQLILIAGGNYAWLNWLTVVLGVAAFGDGVVGSVLPIEPPELAPRSLEYDVLLYGLGFATAAMSIKPVLNLISKDQAMNATYNPLHLVGSYGAFGSVTRERYEIVIEGTRDEEITPETEWRAYELKGKPGDPKRLPGVFAPYHLRLDWLMWFLPLRARVTKSGVFTAGYERWFVRFIEKLLEGDRATLGLLKSDPFGAEPPRSIRASFYRYHLVAPHERRRTGLVWKREFVDLYLPALALQEDRGGREPHAEPLPTGWIVAPSTT